MSKIELSPVPTGVYPVTAINNRLQQIEDALNDDVLWRNNPVDEPNAMSNDLDMAGNDILNLPLATLPTSPVRLDQVNALIEGSDNWSEIDSRLTAVEGDVEDIQQEVDALQETALSVYDTVAAAAAVSLPVGAKISTKGADAVGDGGHGDFIVYATAPTTEDGYSVAETVNGNYLVLQPVNGRIAAQCLGVFATGLDETAGVLRCRDFSHNARCEIIFPAGTILTNEIPLNAIRFKIRGERRETTVIKLNNSRNTHIIDIVNGGRLYAEKITLDQNKANQTSGHTIRSGGCDALELRDVTLKNCKGYNLGIQQGSNFGVILRDCFLLDSDEDGFDLKDYNYNNGCVVLDNVEVRNFGSSNSSVGVDIRGEAQIVNLRVFITGDRRGLRLRDDASGQGRAAFGNFTNISVEGSSNSVGSALEIASSSRRFTVNNVTAEFIGAVILHANTARGGQISNITATNIGGDAFSFFGQDLTVNNVSVTNTGTSQRIADFEPTAVNVVVNNFGFNETTAATDAVRVQSGVANCAMSNGWIRGGGVGGAGLAGMTQTNIRLI